MAYKILAINLGSTSTKIAVYEDNSEIYKESINHSPEDLKPFSDIWEQIGFRKKIVFDSIESHGFTIEQIDCFITRGGCVKPVSGGIYEINREMLEDLKCGAYGIHPTALGSFIGYEINEKYGIPAIFADAPTTDELSELARFSGIKEISRFSSFHALNQKRTARKIASEEFGRDYTEMNFIVCHLGGGVSVGAHEKGRVIDVNNALEGDGPFSPERAGGLPVGDVIKMCFSGEFSEKQMMYKIRGGGGFMSYLGTNSGLEVEKRIGEGDENALRVMEALAYQISKEIGAASCVLKGRVDAVLLTGSLAYSERLTKLIKERAGFIAPFHICPGENEMVSLAENAVRYMYKKEEPKTY